jgi:extradiol dioxygenase family protein
MVARLQAAAARFLVAPHLARVGTSGEQLITLVEDGCGNVVEFKGMDAATVFAR